MIDIVKILYNYWKTKHPKLSLIINKQTVIITICLFLIVNPYILNIKIDNIIFYIIYVLFLATIISLIITTLRYVYFLYIKKKHELKRYIINKYTIKPDDLSSKDEDYDNMTGEEFEVFCYKILVKNGYKNVKLTKTTGDQGVDIVATKDLIKYAIQCKCYNQPIGNKAIQEVYSGKDFYNCHVAVVMTNQTFTSSAKALAQKNNVLLWDRGILNNLIYNARINKI